MHVERMNFSYKIKCDERTIEVIILAISQETYASTLLHWNTKTLLLSSTPKCEDCNKVHNIDGFIREQIETEVQLIFEVGGNTLRTMHPSEFEIEKLEEMFEQYSFAPT